MSKKDGKVTLIGATNRKGFHTIHVGDDEFDENVKAGALCPVNIIKVKQIYHYNKLKTREMGVLKVPNY
jgi:ferredoxin